jgi:tRNA G10  N-methylase Trm11
MSAFPDLQPDKPVGPILPSVFQGSNADLMLAVAPFYLTGSVCDVTYGEGKWWDRFTPDPFTAHDLYKLDGVDFRALPEADDSVDTVCLDPPYAASGKSATTTVPGFQNRYGIGQADGAARGSVMKELMRDGIREACRVARQFVLVKCMEYADNGFHDVPMIVSLQASEAGYIKHDVIVHYTGSGPGGHNIFDPRRARRHHSYLLVFAKP